MVARGINTLCWISGSDGHRGGVDKIFSEGQQESEQPNAVSESTCNEDLTR